MIVTSANDLDFDFEIEDAGWVEDINNLVRWSFSLLRDKPYNGNLKWYEKQVERDRPEREKKMRAMAKERLDKEEK